MSNWFRNLSIRSKLLLGFGFTSLVLAALVAFSLGKLRDSNDRVEHMYNDAVKPLKDLGVATRRHNQVRLALRMLLEAERPEDRAAAERQIVDRGRELDEALAEYGRSQLSESEKQLYPAMATSLKAYRDALDQELLPLARRGDLKAARAVANGAMAGHAREVGDQLEKLIDVNVQLSEGYYRANQAAYLQTRSLSLALLALGVGAAISGGLLVSALLSRSAERVKAAMAALAEGDLTARASVEGRDEMGQIAQSMNDMASRLRSLVAQIQGSAQALGGASREIAQGNQDLSGRTEEQAANLEETAASMEELASTVTQTSESARGVSRDAQLAQQVAEGGGRVVGRLVEAMGGIRQGADRIADIIGVVDEIAFQTNLLALNAAVEAARAGEQGRGFAVVAAEVRNLAKRSAEAAKEIKALIKASVGQAQDGASLAEEAGKAMAEVLGSVARVSDLVRDITTATHEQTTGIQEVNKAVMQMDEVTQQNAALVEQVAAAAESMSEEVQGLLEAVGRFRTGSDQLQAPAPAVLRAPAAPRPSRLKTARPAQAVVPVRPALPVPAPGDDGTWETF